MLNLLRPALNRLLTPIGEALARTPVTPNAITVTGTVGVAAAALWLLPTGHLFAGAAVCTVFALADMLDGTLARVTGTTGAWGAFLDSTLDRVGDAAIFAGLAAWLARGGHQPALAGGTGYCLVAGGVVSYAAGRAGGSRLMKARLIQAGLIKARLFKARLIQAGGRARDVRAEGLAGRRRLTAGVGAG